MRQSKFCDYIFIDAYSATPKYLQLTNTIISAVETGRITKDMILPSINELSYELEISRDTVEKGYRHLKKMGVLGSVPGKGYFIQNINFRQQFKIFLLFNKLSAHKKIMYDAFAEALGEKASIDFYVYNNDLALFKRILNNRREEYTHYVIIPHFIEGAENAKDVINTIPKEKLILLDKKISGISGEYASVYENFERDIYFALDEAKTLLGKYHTIKLIFPDKSYYPSEIITGFKRFCQQYAFKYKIVSDIAKEPISGGEAYINLMEGDLVCLIERLIETRLKIGTDVGVISYNETPLKKLILNGITTISTDFYEMGRITANVILDNSREHIAVPFHLELRASL